MNRIALVVFLAAAGCSRKSGTDCGVAIGQGIDRYLGAAKEMLSESPRLEATLSIAGKLKAAMTERCRDDEWAPEVVACFAAIARSNELKACQGKLTQDQRTKLVTEVASIMASGSGPGGSRMPPGLAGHPPALTGGAGGSSSPPGGAAGATPTGSAPSSTTPSVSGTPAAPRQSGSSAN